MISLFSKNFKMFMAVAIHCTNVTVNFGTTYKKFLSVLYAELTYMNQKISPVSLHSL